MAATASQRRRTSGASPFSTRATAEKLVRRAGALQKQFPVYQPNLALLGPAEAPLFKLRGRYRFQVLVKCDSAQRLNRFCRQILADEDWIPSGTKVQVDIDPFQMM